MVFSKKPATLEEIREGEENREKSRRIGEHLKNIELFPGSLNEYERLKGQEYKIVDTGECEKFIVLWNSLDESPKADWLYKNNIEALVRYKDNRELDGSSCGIPVRRKFE